MIELKFLYQLPRTEENNGTIITRTKRFIIISVL